MILSKRITTILLLILSSVSMSQEVKEILPGRDFAVPPLSDNVKTIAPSKIIDLEENVFLGSADYAYFYNENLALLFGDSKEEGISKALYIYDLQYDEYKRLWGAGSSSLQELWITPDKKYTGLLMGIYEGDKNEIFFLNNYDMTLKAMNDYYFNHEKLLALLNNYWTRYYKIAENNKKWVFEWEMYGHTVLDFFPEWKDKIRDKNDFSYYYYVKAILPSVSEGSKEQVKYEISTTKSAPEEFYEGNEAYKKNGKVFYPKSYFGLHFGHMEPVVYKNGKSILQPFVWYLNPENMKICSQGAITIQSDRGFSYSQTKSTSYCARFTGLIEMNSKTGALVKIYNHGVGYPRGKYVRENLIAFSAGTDYEYDANYVSLWNNKTGKYTRLTLPTAFVLNSPVDSVYISDNKKKVIGVSGYPHPKLIIWNLSPANSRKK